MEVPSFAVVGRPNKGKSSIVATLSRDDSVYIDQRVGSTRKTQSFPMVIGDATQYVLYDTPGMQRARTMLAWLEAHATDASSRPATVRRFLEEHRDDERYDQECEMLMPIVAGAGIIYVVDGSCPFGPEYEPEMEILRWTGNPSLALINPIHNQDYIQDWQNGLSQYFRTVRVFDAHHAEFRKQLDLPILTDVHEDTPMDEVADVVDVLQTPAFLCRQTNFILRTVATGLPVNVKKGQFLSPWEMQNVVDKARSTGNDSIMVCERGFSFGYNNLVSDMRSLAVMRGTGCPVVFDATHSVQLPGGQGTTSGGQREFIPVLARAATAVGVAAALPTPEAPVVLAQAGRALEDR